jgi:DNA invertase Pin-like site-specific DNA recombinase
MREGTVQAVVAYHEDRLHRHPRELEDFIELADARRVKLATVTGDVDLSTDDGRMRARIMGAVARNQSDATSRRVRRAFEAKAAKGEWKNGGERPFGYEWSKEKQTLVPYEPEAKLIREAAKRILDGESRRRIVLGWHERGLRTSKDKPWSITRLADLMRSPTIAALRTYKGEVVAEGTWKPLIDRRTWEAVNKRLRRVGGGHRGKQRHLLTGTVVCGRCGQRLSAKMRRDYNAAGTRTYKCVSDSAASCGQLTVIAEPVEKIVLDTAWFWFEPEPVYASNGDSPELRAVEDALAELDETERNLAHDHYTEKIITRAVFLQEMTKVRDAKADLERQLGRLEKTAQGVVVTSAQLASLQGPPETLTGAEPEVIEFWRSVVATVFEKVIIRPAGKGRRFTPDRVELVPRPEYPDADHPVLPDEEGAA